MGSLISGIVVRPGPPQSLQAASLLKALHGPVPFLRGSRFKRNPAPATRPPRFRRIM